MKKQKVIPDSSPLVTSAANETVVHSTLHPTVVGISSVFFCDPAEMETR